MCVSGIWSICAFIKSTHQGGMSTPCVISLPAAFEPRSSSQSPSLAWGAALKAQMGRLRPAWAGIGCPPPAVPAGVGDGHRGLLRGSCSTGSRPCRRDGGCSPYVLRTPQGKPAGPPPGMPGDRPRDAQPLARAAQHQGDPVPAGGQSGSGAGPGPLWERAPRVSWGAGARRQRASA